MSVLTARTDVHRPGAMNPADYEVLAVACLYTEESLETGRDETVFELDGVSDTWEAMGKPAAGSWNGHVPGTCDHCGHALKYYCIVLHKATGDLLEIGRDCVRRFFDFDWTLQEQNLQARKRREANTAKFLAKYPHAEAALNWALTEGRGAPADIAEKAVVKGYDISDKQAALLVSCHEKAVAPVAYATGRQTITGTITKATASVDDYASTRYFTAYKWNISVRTAEGVVYYGTLPRDFCPCRPEDAAEVVGATVTFTANVEAKDSGFAKYSRPTKFSIDKSGVAELKAQKEAEAAEAQAAADAKARQDGFAEALKNVTEEAKFAAEAAEHFGVELPELYEAAPVWIAFIEGLKPGAGTPGGVSAGASKKDAANYQDMTQYVVAVRALQNSVANLARHGELNAENMAYWADALKAYGIGNEAADTVAARMDAPETEAALNALKVLGVAEEALPAEDAPRAEWRIFLKSVRPKDTDASDAAKDAAYEALCRYWHLVQDVQEEAAEAAQAAQKAKEAADFAEDMFEDARVLNDPAGEAARDEAEIRAAYGGGEY